ncbi:MAG: LLM class flavin-dependent oxidoreductase [Labilithrix sp.]|nr:LLM class flavin-dependent oxidoreductase [Labilithrix sp.]
MPVGVAPPPIFLLGASVESAGLAARLGVGFAFAHHIEPEHHVAATRAYREAFRPSRGSPEPYAILAASVLCAADDAAAEDLARAADLSWLRFGQGLRDLPLPSVEEARAYRFDADEEALRRPRRYVAGGPARVKDELAGVLADTAADELMVTSAIHDHEERKRSYARLAEILGVTPR